ncbi:Clp1/GlmU family protein [Methanofollis fontis]|uniref:polynucleotide 5'-hydroxyl-kinase n=1 Tax=Methanofollis fontis TaxID=2052832 RepID=A0A483CRX4_9EURY|nr:Clp1/GlmU family protein [Methanofollis fontis]TAJ44961.1 hypothetical protein CUJ86_06690 [Methanofollis fontis]
MVIPGPGWEEICDIAEGTVFLLGGTGAGKTTLAGYIRGQVGDGVAWIDGDPGQSAVGPPGTLGLTRPDGTVSLRFTGATSPSMAPLATLSALRCLLDEGKGGGASTVLVDSCGYIYGEGGVEFQRRSIEVLAPDQIIAIGSTAELNAILSPFMRRPGLRVHRLPVSPHARRRSQSARRRYRQERLLRWMEEAEVRRWGEEIIRAGFFPERPRGHIAAVCDPGGRVLTAGIILGVGRDMVVLAAPPPFAGEPAYFEAGRFRPGTGCLPSSLMASIPPYLYQDSQER